ncbi:S-methyl-5'-thioinosine phosphorylase [Wenzhouxiangella sp. AB-CW3]|uniref:S-methyl-5'-thioinosine phosphorylase n=1 Tax=Wenzhouxiangella sp. AB-CW3 TaxID=2771012 RepID=UPI00168A85E0|nr:S-methyl-5'-thioinosine phosphorylase [Wenzhouxiangella sp. AB-CW3]QOC21264.1 S-methyl-5'-thioinosine phosphorylase [Wenzhouxiangella sp. AB-CW3]
MNELAIIGGTGALDLFPGGDERVLETDWGDPSANVVRVRLGQYKAWFLARHGRPHRLPPHRIDYRANIDGLRRLGVKRVVAINAVGAVDPGLAPGSLVIPDQLVDYTWGRAHTFSDDGRHPLEHVEFAKPFEGPLRSALLAAGQAADIGLVDGGCIAVTQGPRLETAAEIRRLARDGCDLVGMTAMPEVSLAREAGIDYASLCVVANPGAGLEEEPISLEEIHQVLSSAMISVQDLLAHLSL